MFEYFIMPRIVLTSTHLCNLKCKLCSQGVPFYKNPYNPSFEELKAEITAYFDLVSAVDILEISGGEPLLRKDLDLVLNYLHNYENRINKEIRVTTNANIIPNDDIISASVKFGSKMIFLLDDYISSIKTKEIEKVLNKNNLKCRIRDYNNDLHYNGWVNFSDFSLKYSKEESKKVFSECAFPSKLGFCFEIAHGEMHPCIKSKRCMEHGIIPKNSNEYIDLFDESESKETKLNKLKNIYKLDRLSACAYCYGLSENSPRYIPAEQFTKEELNQIHREGRKY